MNNLNNAVVFFSNAYAGIASYQAQNITYLLKKRINIFLFDERPELTVVNLKKKINIIKTKNPYNFFVNQKIFIKNINLILKKYNKVYISISNPIFLVIYFFFFNKIRKNPKIKIILTVHSGILTWSIKNIILTFFYSLIYFLPHKIIFVSNYTKIWWLNFWYLRKLIHRNKIIRHGTEVRKVTKKKFNKKIFNVGFVGRIEEEKSPMLFVSVALESYLQNQNFRFYVFGEGGLKSEMIKKSLGLINFRGWQKKQNIYKSLDILLVTSPIETLSYVALEAKIYGIPTVTCSKGGITEVVRNNYDGLITKEKDKNMLLNLLVKCKKNYKKFSNNAFLNSNEFDEKKSLNKFWIFIST